LEASILFFPSYFSSLSCFFSLRCYSQRTVSLDLHPCYLINHHRSPVQSLTSTTVSLHSYHHKKVFLPSTIFPEFYVFMCPSSLFLFLTLYIYIYKEKERERERERKGKGKRRVIYIYIHIYIYKTPLSLSSPHSSGFFPSWQKFSTDLVFSASKDLFHQLQFSCCIHFVKKKIFNPSFLC
jgi:hypothetical protein